MSPDEVKEFLEELMGKANSRKLIGL